MLRPGLTPRQTLGFIPGPTPRLMSRTVRAGLTEQAAAEFVRRHGRGALTILGERAEMAAELGHRVAAKTWREMADAVAWLLRSRKSEVDLTRPAAPQSGIARDGSMFHR
jgi:hypothetical protein